MKSRVDFRGLAKKILFGGISGEYVKSQGFEYRKGKDFGSISRAVEMAFKNGHGKTEFEIDMLEIYLKNVFKVYKKMEDLKDGRKY